MGSEWAHVYYSDGEVQVTDLWIWVGGQTYALKDVEWATMWRSGRQDAITVVLAASLIGSSFFCALALLDMSRSRPAETGFEPLSVTGLSPLLIMLGLAVVALITATLMRDTTRVRTIYHLRLDGTFGTLPDVFASASKEKVKAILASIEQAQRDTRYRTSTKHPAPTSLQNPPV